MKFTVNWLKKYIDFDLSNRQLADRLTMAGLEVDCVEDLYPGLDALRVARIAKVQPHPNADRLSLCEVDDGEGIRRVVCGAPNVRAGMLTALAVPGTVMPGGFKIKPAKIRGEASEGMLCSANELGISADKAGIMDLPTDLAPGQSLVEALGLADTLIEVDLTPNRPDCASVIGTAREVGGFVGKRVKHPGVADLPELRDNDLPFSVEVKDSGACPRYSARMIKGVKIAPSPWWLQRFLLAVGLRPINNVVDVTNFVMLEYGQPLHAFDFAKLAGGRIIVRRAGIGEKTETLDGVERQLDEEMLLICDAERPVAVAGVMGGGNSEVSDDTADILLESACFDPVSIRRTSRRLNLATDSSYRFERGVDPQGTVRALERAVGLIVELAGGAAVPGGVDLKEGLRPVVPIELRVRRCNDLLGLRLSAEQIGAYLEAIEIATDIVDSQTLKVTPPGFRVDLEREVDLFEEVARLVGYNEIPTTLPHVPLSFADRDPARELRREVASIMTAQGYNEAINYSFVSERHYDMLGLDPAHPARHQIKLLNPLAEDQSVMRTMLLPGILENLRRNVNHQRPDIRLFEVGKVFHPTGAELPDEEVHMVAVISGRRNPDSPLIHFGEAECDFFDIKACADNLLTELRRCEVEMTAPAEPPEYVGSSPYLALGSGDLHLGGLGRLSADCLKAFGIKTDVYFLEVSLTGLAKTPARPKSFQPLSRYPSVNWDLAMLVPEDVAAGAITAAVKNCGEKILADAELVDIFRGGNIEDGYKSVAITVTYRDENKTLEDETVQKAHQKIIDFIGTRFGGKLREA
ncbi:MAG: phenylalanine--tRNA ligase subunit beta [Desulfurivibrionaceae bacterium]|nr:phenylalanine--tRNA ligase subunit beta [Desulfobulbales bacterium]MDT8334681.1 phenylalanine--tRNA ligase subunit beta [Desulfurivibrionaceae bacterium]